MHKRLRTFAFGALVGALALTSLPVLSASSAGSISLVGVGEATPVASGVTPFTWEWTPGSVVRSNSIIDLRLVNTQTGTLVMRKYRYVRWGSFSWDTSNAPDGLYTVTAHLRQNSTISSILAPIYIDNTAPTVSAITKPAPSGVILEGEKVVESRIVAGTTELAADASDNLSGVTAIEWYLDADPTDPDATPLEVTVAEDGTTSFDFSQVAAGPHTLTAVAVDAGGNRGASSEQRAQVEILVVGAGVDASVVPNPDDILPSDDPEPSPSPEPSLPELPEQPELPEDTVPSPDPSALPTPDPSDPPTLPIPTEPPVPIT